MPEPWSKHGKGKIRCFIKPQGPATTTTTTTTTTTPTSICIDVYACLVERQISLEPTFLDFGQIAVGQRKVRREGGGGEGRGRNKREKGWMGMDVLMTVLSSQERLLVRITCLLLL